MDVTVIRFLCMYLILLIEDRRHELLPVCLSSSRRDRIDPTPYVHRAAGASF